MISKHSSQYIPCDTILNAPKQNFKIPTKMPSLLNLNSLASPAIVLEKNENFVKKNSSDSISTREDDSSDEETMTNCSLSILDILSRKFDISN